MRILAVLVPLILCVLMSFGQSSLPIGEKQLNVGSGKSTGGVPIYVGLDYGLSQDITLGGEFSARRSLGGWKEPQYREDLLGLGANINYHFNRLIGIPGEWDAYIGLNGGYYFNISTSQDYNGFGVGGQLGGRYFIDNNIAIHLEFGPRSNGLAGINLGITYKFLPKRKKKKSSKKSTSS